MPWDPFVEAALLDWVLQGGTPTRPGKTFVMWATQSPTSQSAFDGPFTPRRTVTFGAAASPAGTASNIAALTFTATAIGTAIGWNLYDNSVGGNRLAYGTLTSSVGCASADLPAFAAGALRVKLS